MASSKDTFRKDQRNFFDWTEAPFQMTCFLLSVLHSNKDSMSVCFLSFKKIYIKNPDFFGRNVRLLK